MYCDFLFMMVFPQSQIAVLRTIGPQKEHCAIMPLRCIRVFRFLISSIDYLVNQLNCIISLLLLRWSQRNLLMPWCSQPWKCFFILALFRLFLYVSTWIWLLSCVPFSREELKLCRQNIESLVEQRDDLEKEIEQQKAEDNRWLQKYKMVTAL